MTTLLDYIQLIQLLGQAERLAAQSSGGYSGRFLSAEEFHKTLSESIEKLKQGDQSQLKILYVWFLPTSAWDDFTGGDGVDLGNEICTLLSKLTG